MGFSEDETFALMVGTGVSGGLSILGSLFIIGSALAFRKLKRQYWRFVVGLTLVDLLLGVCMASGSVAWLAGWTFTGTLCDMQGWTITFGGQASNMYILIISILIYSATIRGKELSIPAEIALHVTAWVFGTLFSVVPFFGFDDFKYVPAGGWCWLGEEPKYARFVLLYIAAWVIIAIILVIYFRVWIFIRQQETHVAKKKGLLHSTVTGTESAEEVQKRKTMRALFLYPMAAIILWVLPSVSRIYELWLPPIFVLVACRSWSYPLQGAIDAFVYGLTSGVTKDIQMWWRGETNLYQPINADTSEGSNVSIGRPSVNTVPHS
jgi:hypothetical protein